MDAGQAVTSVKLLILCAFCSMLVIYSNMSLDRVKKTDTDKTNEINKTILRFGENVTTLKDYLGTKKMSNPHDLGEHLLNTNPFVYSVFYCTPNSFYYDSRDVIKLSEQTSNGWETLEGIDTWSDPKYEYVPGTQESKNQVLYYVIRGEGYAIGFTVKFDVLNRS